MDVTYCIEKNEIQVIAREKYDLYKSLLYRIAFSYTGNPQDCDDILQEAFIKLFYHSPEFPSLEDEKCWLIRITINLCKNYVNTFWNRNKISIDAIEAYTYETEEREIIQQLVKLPEKYKTVIQLYYIVGYQISEIAQFLNLSESAIKMRLNRGRKLLKIELEAEI